MAVYQKWGAEGFAKLVGDWSLVVWDAEKQAVVMASDYMGVRPLHYYAQRDFVSWSTTIECLVHFHELYHQLEPRYLFRLVTFTRSFVMTPYKGVVAVPPARSLTFTRSRPVEEKRFWTLGSLQIRYSDETEYDEHLRTLFLETVQNRLRSASQVWSHLSGGLDSSAIVCAADILLKQGRAVAPNFCTLSYVTDNSPEADESRFIACVEQHIGRAGHRLIQDHNMDKVDPTRHWITPAQPPFASMQAYQLIRDMGGRVLLTGAFGDSVMANFIDYHYDVAQLLRRGKPGAAVGLARQRALAGKQSIWEVLYSAALELLPLSLLVPWTLSRVLASSGGTPPATDEHIADAFLLKTTYAKWWKEDFATQCARELAFPDLSQRLMATEVMGTAEYRFGQSPSEVPLVCHSHPYLDRRLVEFMLGIPIGVSAPPGKPRGLMRRAFAPFMPPRIIGRFSKCFASPFYLRNSREILLRWVNRPDDLKVLQFEFLDRNRLVRYLETLRDTGRNPKLFLSLLKIEQWLESREHYLQGLSQATRPVARAAGISPVAERVAASHTSQLSQWSAAAESTDMLIVGQKTLCENAQDIGHSLSE
jgi:asparagine synthase (glutamine-hydrolysing)